MNDNNDKTPREILQEKDEVTLVSSDGELLGRKDKKLAHQHPVPLHLAISVWLFNSKKQVLFQKRSAEKILGAGWWANTVCGNVRPTETFYDCSHRRLSEELGITNQIIEPAYKFSYKAYCDETYGENEIDQVYVGMYSKNSHPSNKILFNHAEVSDLLWIDFDDLVSKVQFLEYPSAEQTLIHETQDLKNQTPAISLKVSTDDSQEIEILIAPWTIFMLRSQHLYDAVQKLQFA